MQVMTFLVENEEAALVVPARFLGQIHPHFREIQQMLAITVADEARHIEVFTRRAALTEHAARPVDRRRTGVAADPARRARLRHRLVPAVGDGRGHVRLAARVPRTPRARPAHPAHRPPHPPGRGPPRGVRPRPPRAPRGHRPERRGRASARAVERRHAALRTTAGLNDEVFDSLVLLAAGAATPTAVAAGWRAVHELQRDMDDSRRQRLARLGFTPGETEALVRAAHPQLHVRVVRAPPAHPAHPRWRTMARVNCRIPASVGVARTPDLARPGGRGGASMSP